MARIIKCFYAATKHTACRGSRGGFSRMSRVRLPFTIAVTAGRTHKSLYDLSLKTDFM